MSDATVLNLTKEDGIVKQKRVPISYTVLDFHHQHLTAVSDNVAQLTRVGQLWLQGNAFTELPVGVLAMTQLCILNLCDNRLVEIPREIGRMRVLLQLWLDRNKIAAVPREIGLLCALQYLSLGDNALTSLPTELSELQSLKALRLFGCRLAWLPAALDRLPPSTWISLSGNPLPIDLSDADEFTDSRPKLPEIFAATTALAMIRDPAFIILVALQDLDLPALVTLEIIDAAFPNSIPMHKKWNLVTAVKHFHQRRGIER